MGPLGWTEMVVIFIIALVVFGPEKLPDLAKTAAKGLRQFRRATDDLKASWHEHIRDVDNPVNEIKQTFQEAKADMEEVSAKLMEEEFPALADTPQEPMPETIPETIPESKPETKADAN